MKIFRKGQVVNCKNCGEKIYYLNGEVDINSDIEVFNQVAIPFDLDQDEFIPNHTECFNCGKDVTSTFIKIVKEEKNHDFKHTQLCNLSSKNKKNAIKWLNNS